MALHFPNLDTLRLALTSGAVPPGVSLAPVRAAPVAAVGFRVRPSVPLTKTAHVKLRRLGVEVREADGALEELSCWPQIVPLEQVDPTAGVTAQTAVLFELRPASLLAEVAGEILRLGNDRQTFRWLSDGEDDAVLLRVIGPPYYTLLRACDRERSEQAPHAYVERAPRVWIELGWSHPLAQQLRPPDGKLLLLRPPRQWRTLDEAPFKDIYDILEFPLPVLPTAWRDREPPTRLKVPLG